jgi:hypothetical protein
MRDTHQGVQLSYSHPVTEKANGAVASARSAPSADDAISAASRTVTCVMVGV